MASGSSKSWWGLTKRRERKEEREREKKLRRSTRYGDSDYDNYLGLNCRCEVRGMAVKTGQVERGKPVNSLLIFCIFSRRILLYKSLLL